MRLLSFSELQDLGWVLSTLNERAVVACQINQRVSENLLFFQSCLYSLFSHFCVDEPLSFFDFENHPDVWCLLKEKVLKADLKVIDELVLMPPLFARRRFLVLNCEGLTEQAFQSLLKSFEEPESPCLILLLVQRDQMFPSTVESRCLKSSLMVDQENERQAKEEFKKRLKPVLVESFQNAPRVFRENTQWTWEKTSPTFYPQNVWKLLDSCPSSNSFSEALWEVLWECSSDLPLSRVQRARQELVWWEQNRQFHLKPTLFLFRFLCG
jgi:hypothetical protein